MPARPKRLPQPYDTRSRGIHNQTRARGLTTRPMSASGTVVAHISGQHKRASGPYCRVRDSAPERATGMPPAYDLHSLSGHRESVSSAVSESTPQPHHAGADQPDASAARTANETVKRGRERSRFNGAGRMLSHTSPHGVQCKAHLQSEWKSEASSCSAAGW